MTDDGVDGLYLHIADLVTEASAISRLDSTMRRGRGRIAYSANVVDRGQGESKHCENGVFQCAAQGG